MINKEFVYNNILPKIKEECRMIDYYLIQNLFEDKQKEIVEELKKYQNQDLGLGNALEPDTRLPNSSILATSTGINILDNVKDETIKEELVKDLVEYLENNYNEKDKRYYMIPKESDEYPHAIWWNYKDLKTNFPFGNPDPEIIGFLYKYRKHVKKINLNKQINQVIEFIKSDSFLEGGFHTLMSVIRFYNRMDDDIKNLIHDRIHDCVDKEIKESLGKWNDYSLEPYKIYVINSHYTENFSKELQENLSLLLQEIKSLKVLPKWKWYQYEEVFEDIKMEWAGHIYFEYIKALRYHREL